MKPFTLIRPYLKYYRCALCLYTALTLLAASVAILAPFILGDFLDTLIEGADISAVIMFCVTFGGLSIGKILLNYIIAMMHVRLQTKMSYNLSAGTVKHVQNISLSHLAGQESAYLSQRINNDTYSLVSFFMNLLQNVPSKVVTFIVPFFILLGVNASVAVLLMAFLLIYTLLYLLFKKPLYKASAAFKEAQSKFFSKLFDQLKYVKLIKLNAIQPQMNQKLDSSFYHLQGATLHNQKINYLYSGLDGFVTTLAQIALFVVGGLQILAGNFTIGMFTIFSSYFNMMIGAIRYFFSVGAAYQATLVASDRLLSSLSLPREANGSTRLRDVDSIQLEDVSFSYRTGKEVVKNYSRIFNKGKVYGIVGGNGIGKTTLLDLVMGMYLNEFRGNISYNCIDIREIDMENARKTLIGFAEQEPVLLNDTIAYNLTFEAGDEGLDLHSPEMARHLYTLGMEDFIDHNTFELEINDKGENTSGGEKQKISILKVLAKNPCVMIFDEPTSALDAETTERFIDYLLHIKKDKIIILITHDTSIQEKCDELVVL